MQPVMIFTAAIAAAALILPAIFALQNEPSIPTADAPSSRRRQSKVSSSNADDTSNNNEQLLLQQIILASTHLISLEFSSNHSIGNDSYSGVTGVFCALDFGKQKLDPTKVPMFRDLITASGCDEGSHQFRMDLSKAVESAHEYDVEMFRQNYNAIHLNTTGPSVNILSLRGAIFHESRCGSTLAANALVALHPEKNRVYSESTPPKQVLKLCDEDFSKCTIEGAANLLRDVVYIMGRSNMSTEENLFFKFQSATTKTMQVFREAFPSTPWIFLYREPVEVMQSHLNVKDTSHANCVRNKKSPMLKLMAKKLRVKLNTLKDEELCALHLASICGSAIVNLEDANGLGMALSYHKDMSTEFLDYIFPIHFHTPVRKDGYRRVMQVSKLYSKSHEGNDEVFESDRDEKRAKASTKVKDAAVEYLDPSYKSLEKSEFNFNKICKKANLDSKLSSLYCRALGGKRASAN